MGRMFTEAASFLSRLALKQTDTVTVTRLSTQHLKNRDKGQELGELPRKPESK